MGWKSQMKCEKNVDNSALQKGEDRQQRTNFLLEETKQNKTKINLVVAI